MRLRRRMVSHAVVARPSTSTSPSVGSRSRLISFSVVVLPEPLRPSNTRVSPRRTCKHRLVRRARPPLRRYPASQHSITFCCPDDGSVIPLVKFGPPNLRPIQSCFRKCLTFTAALDDDGPEE